MEADLSYLTSSDRFVGLGLGIRGTGEVASIRAGFKMIGRDMGGTPTCRGEARGCRMRGDWLKGEGPWGEDVVSGTGMAGIEGGTGDDRSDPRKHRDKKNTERTCERSSETVTLVSF